MQVINLCGILKLSNVIFNKILTNMRDKMIQESLNFLKKEEVKNVPFDEKVQYLKGKLTEEELSEVLSRFNIFR